ncbi:MAG: DNA polymerase III subunit gamma/tau [Candidatus Moranbacteria bacterium]|nr:DNA polymerase III subunit gamma/tau [Candidatus Moranbacteria bacterium]
MSFLYNKYRPQKFQDVTGQDFPVQSLKNSIKLDNIGHAFLFCGPRGTGKTSLARIFARAVNCLQPNKGEPCNECKNCKLIISGETLDMVEIDAASHTGVDNIRELKESLYVVAGALKYKVYIIDEVHMLSKGAFNALLKSLEEPPKQVIFILATTELGKVPATVISRCQKFDFKRLSNQAIVEKLKRILKQENKKASEETLNQIAVLAQGGMRDAESLLSQLINMSDKEIEFKTVKELLGIPSSLSYAELLNAIIQDNQKQAFKIITDLVYSGQDMKYYLENLLDYVREIIVYKIDSDYETVLEEKFGTQGTQAIQDLEQKTDQAMLAKMTAEFLKAKTLLQDSPLPQLPLELAVLNLTRAKEKEQPQKKQETNLKAEKIKKQAQTQEEKLVKPAVNQFKEQKSSKSDKKILTKAPSKQEVWAKWNEAAEAIGEHNRALQGVFKGAELIDVSKDGRLKIALKYDFYKKRLEQKEVKRLLNQVFLNIFNYDFDFEYIIKKPSEGQDNQKKKIGADQNKVKKDDPVQEILEEFGGEIIE